MGSYFFLMTVPWTTCQKCYLVCNRATSKVLSHRHRGAPSGAVGHRCACRGGIEHPARKAFTRGHCCAVPSGPSACGAPMTQKVGRGWQCSLSSSRGPRRRWKLQGGGGQVRRVARGDNLGRPSMGSVPWSGLRPSMMEEDEPQASPGGGRW